MPQIDIQEGKKGIANNIKWEVQEIKPIGGQHAVCAKSKPITLYSEELDIRITVGFHSSRAKNKLLAYTLFLLAVDDLIY